MQTAPAATIPAVTLPEKCPPPLLSWNPWYFTCAVKSACEGLAMSAVPE